MLFLQPRIKSAHLKIVSSISRVNSLSVLLPKMNSCMFRWNAMQMATTISSFTGCLPDKTLDTWDASVNTGFKMSTSSACFRWRSSITFWMFAERVWSRFWMNLNCSSVSSWKRPTGVRGERVSFLGLSTVKWNLSRLRLSPFVIFQRCNFVVASLYSFVF